MKARFGEKIKLKAFDFSGRFADWETALRYADVLRHHNPYNFEQPSNNYPGMRRVCQADGCAGKSAHQQPRGRLRGN